MKNKDFLLFAGVVIGIIAVASVLSFATGNVLVPIPGDSTPIDCKDSDFGKSGDSLLINGSVVYTYTNLTSGSLQSSKQIDICSSYYGLTEYYCTYDKKPAYIQRNCNKNFLTDKKICFEGECRAKSECEIYNLYLKKDSSKNVSIFTFYNFLRTDILTISLVSVTDDPLQSYKRAVIKLTKDRIPYGYSQYGTGTFLIFTKRNDVVPVYDWYDSDAQFLNLPGSGVYFLNLQLTSIDTTAQTAKIRVTTCRPDY